MKKLTAFSVVLALSVLVVACGGADPTNTTGPGSVATTGVPSTTAPAATTTPGADRYPEAAIDFFVEVAFGSEFGSDHSVVRKWKDDIKIRVFGDASQADLDGLAAVVSDLSDLIDTINIEIVSSGENVEIHFAPEAQFPQIEPNYVPGNTGFFWLFWDGQGYIYDARILISTTGITQAERNHLTREELTQVLGLMNDSWTYPDSIFYQGWTDVQSYTEIDRMIIEMLYLPEVKVDMTYIDAVAAILGR